MKVVNAAVMRELDARTIQSGIHSGIWLMNRAGRAVFESVQEYFPVRKPVAVLAGKGNNGGDGFVIARLLHEAGYPVTVLTPFQESDWKGDALTAYRDMPSCLKETMSSVLSDLQGSFSLIIDALLGTGISGALRSPFDMWIKAVNASGLPVIAVDIPSGLNADTGEVCGNAVQADLTVTFALPKTGLLTGEGARHAGRIHVADIGIPVSFADSVEGTGEVIVPEEIAPLFGREPFDVYKNARGYVLVIGGSRLYSGAPLLAGHAALRTGAGLVSVCAPDCSTTSGFVPHALMMRKLASNGNVFAETAWHEMEPLLGKASSVIAGPGLSDDAAVDSLLEKLLQNAAVPLILDADALNRLSKSELLQRNLLARPRGMTVLTPHKGEMKRLLAGFGLQNELSDEEKAKQLANKTGAVVLLKGPHTLIASPDGRSCRNLSGCTALATAGSGDVLSGMIGALAGRAHDLFPSVCAGVCLHGLTGELAAPVPHSGRGIAADDLIRLIPDALRKISPFA